MKNFSLEQLYKQDFSLGDIDKMVRGRIAIPFYKSGKLFFRIKIEEK